MSLIEQARPDGQREEQGRTGDMVFVEYYTDPLCSWCWAFEAQWRRLRYECAGRLSWRYRMGGLIPNWRSYDDPFNDIRNPAQMGPQWFQVQNISGMPLDEHIWQSDPPASSYPACLAVKAAERQGKGSAELYLRRLREAVMLERRNIARQDILLELAEEVVLSSNKESRFDMERFRADLAAPECAEAFRQDLRDAAYYSIGRFPTLILQRAAGQGIVLVGYRPYDVLCAALEHLVPGLRQQVIMSRDELITTYIAQWGRATAHEVAELLDTDNSSASQLLDTLVAQGNLGHAEIARSKMPIYVPL